MGCFWLNHASNKTGFGNAQNVGRTVRGLASASAACLMLENQKSPKRDFGAPSAVVSRADALRRVIAAVQARDAGADILFVTGPLDRKELERIRAATRLPLIVQVDEPGRALLTSAEVHRIGFTIVAGVTLVFAAAGAFGDAIAHMKAGQPLPPERSLRPRWRRSSASPPISGSTNT